MKKIKDQEQAIDTFLKFCYNFPYDIEERFVSHFGQSMGTHLYKKFRGFCQRKENTFVAMVYCFGDMDGGNRETFLKMVNEYYEQQQAAEIEN